MALSFLMPLFSFAQIEVLQNTFGGISDSNISGSKTDIGVTNMTEKMIDDWKTDADGENVNAILVVFFENMSADDMKQVNISKLSNEKFVSYSDPELHDMSGKLARWFYIPESSSPFDITFSHPRYGEARLHGATMTKNKIYKVSLRAAATVSVSINSTPSGAIVIFDNVRVGTTPCTLPDTPMGKHIISLQSPDSKIANNLDPTSIDVSATNAVFDFNLYKKKDIILKANPSKASLELSKDSKTIAKGYGTLSVKNLDYGTYKVIGYINGERSEANIEVNDRTSVPTVIDVIPSRSISFTAIQNNQQVRGATVNLDGEAIGETPFEKTLNFGNYDVEMFYMGYHKKGKLKINKDSDGKCELELPNRLKTRYNPFNIDYEIHEWGISANYINRCYSFNVNGSHAPYTMWGDEGHESGVQIGFTYQPYFGYGQGLCTGLYYQGFFGNLDEMDASYMDHSLYMPVQYQFRLPLSSNISIFANCGFGFNLGVSHEIDFGDDEKIDVGYGHNEDYDLYFPNEFNVSLLYGFGVQFGKVQLDAKFQKGLNDNKEMYTTDGVDKVSCKLSTWSVGISYLF